MRFSLSRASSATAPVAPAMSTINRIDTMKSGNANARRRLDGTSSPQRHQENRRTDRQSQILGAVVAVEALADVIRAGGTAEVAFQFAALDLLEMAGLGEEEQLVDRVDVDPFDAAEVHAHAKVAEQEERL